MAKAKDKYSIIANKLAGRLSKCKCGHAFLIHTTEDKKLCDWCGNYVFKTPQAEFKYRVAEKMGKKIKEKNNEKMVFDRKKS